MGGREFVAIGTHPADGNVELGESPNGRPVVARNKQQEGLFSVDIIGVEYLPEPPDEWRFVSVAPLVLGALLQLPEVEALAAPDDPLELLGQEHPDDLASDHLVEPLPEGPELFIDAVVEEPQCE